MKNESKNCAGGRAAATLVLVVLLASCASMSRVPPPDAGQEPPPPEIVDELSRYRAAERALYERAAVVVAGFTEAELAGQVIMTAVEGRGRLHDGSRSRLRATKPGAVLLFKPNLDGDKAGITRLIADIHESAAAAAPTEAAETGRLRPFIAVDHEGGTVHRFGAGIERLPPPLSYHSVYQKQGEAAALRLIEEDAARSGREIAALGVTLNLAPVVEILDDSNKRFLDTRAYGYDLDFVVPAAAAFIEGMRQAGVFCVIKHFPGNSNLDPHERTPTLSLGAARLAAYVEPFRAVNSAARPAGLMVSHVIVREWDARRNASLSETVIQQKIRNDLDFDRIVFTDDLAMGAVAAQKTEDAAVHALAAGADMVIAWQDSLLDIHAAILAALRSGQLSRDRLTDAACRVVREKLRLLDGGAL